ncbi:MAG: hypothetical protein ABJH05_18255 [Fulvivirga sp.]
MTDITIVALIILATGIALIIIGVIGIYQKPDKSKQQYESKDTTKTPVDPSIVEKIRNDEHFKKQIKAIIDKQKEDES